MADDETAVAVAANKLLSFYRWVAAFGIVLTSAFTIWFTLEGALLAIDFLIGMLFCVYAYTYDFMD